MGILLSAKSLEEIQNRLIAHLQLPPDITKKFMESVSNKTPPQVDAVAEKVDQIADDTIALDAFTAHELSAIAASIKTMDEVAEELGPVFEIEEKKREVLEPIFLQYFNRIGQKKKSIMQKLDGGNTGLKFVTIALYGKIKGGKNKFLGYLRVEFQRIGFGSGKPLDPKSMKPGAAIDVKSQLEMVIGRMRQKAPKGGWGMLRNKRENLSDYVETLIDMATQLEDIDRKTQQLVPRFYLKNAPQTMKRKPNKFDISFQEAVGSDTMLADPIAPPTTLPVAELEELTTQADSILSMIESGVDVAIAMVSDLTRDIDIYLETLDSQEADQE